MLVRFLVILEVVLVSINRIRVMLIVGYDCGLYLFDGRMLYSNLCRFWYEMRVVLKLIEVKNFLVIEKIVLFVFKVCFLLLLRGLVWCFRMVLSLRKKENNFVFFFCLMALIVIFFNINYINKDWLICFVFILKKFFIIELDLILVSLVLGFFMVKVNWCFWRIVVM